MHYSDLCIQRKTAHLNVYIQSGLKLRKMFANSPLCKLHASLILFENEIHSHCSCDRSCDFDTSAHVDTMMPLIDGLFFTPNFFETKTLFHPCSFVTAADVGMWTLTCGII